MMRAASVSTKGSIELLETARPKPFGPYNVLVKVTHTALNRADTLQIKGVYPPPPWWVDAQAEHNPTIKDIPGLECVGVVEEIVESSSTSSSSSCDFKVGDRVMGIVEGGAYAEYVVTAPVNLMKVPDHLTSVEAACIPEVFLTAYQLLAKVGGLSVAGSSALGGSATADKSRNVFIQAAASSVGLAACQLLGKSKQIFADGAVGSVIGITRSPEKNDAVLANGADLVYNGVEAALDSLAEEKKLRVDLVLDSVVGEGLDQILRSKAINMDAAYVIYAGMGGSKVPTFDTNLLMKNRVRMQASTLRSRSLAYKQELISEFARNALPKFGKMDDPNTDGSKILPNLYKAMPFNDIHKALELMESNTNSGKIVLEM